MTDSVSVPFITVVMPVYNEARFIEQTLRQLLQQEYPADHYEILVADGMSADGTREIVQRLAQEYPQVRLMDNPQRRSSAGRNVGFKNGRGDYFLVVDGHCYIPDAQLLAHVAQCFAESGVDCLGRPQPLNPPGLTPFQEAVALVRASRLGHGQDSLIYGEYEGFAIPVSNGAAYGRHVFEKVGYVDEAFDACEDVEFNYRVEQAGLTCYTSPRLTIRYYPREDLQSLFRQMRRYGEGRFRFVRKHPRALTLNQLIPFGFSTGFVLLALVIVTNTLSTIVGLALFSLYAFYFLLLSIASLSLSIRDKIHNFLIYFIILFIIHFGLGVGFGLLLINYLFDKLKSWIKIK